MDRDYQNRITERISEIVGSHPEQDVREIIKQHYPLAGAVDPLTALLANAPQEAKAIIELAMVMGIHAAIRRLAGSAEFMARPITPSGMTYGDIIRRDW